MPLNLHIEIDSRSGFCYGVANAIRMAEEYLREHTSLHCLGEIVHNEVEVKRLEALGLHIISHDEFNNLHNTTVMLRAHGEPPSTYEKARENNITLIDASCSIVLGLQKKVRKLHQQHKLPMFIFGKHGHAEVKGLTGQIDDDAVVFLNLTELMKHSLPEKIVLVCQTTMDTEELERIKVYLDEKQIAVEFNDTICRQVSNRNKELMSFVNKFDKVVFVAGKKSSNGKALFETCKKFNPDSYFVSDTDELDKSWFSANDRVGICGATSTPAWQMHEIKKVLEEF
jgi:4-hydroxy-3-methylbut-2-enyl diphosphate reductase